jgi:hypothetical protein
MNHEREVAGMRCGEVLAELSDYLDGDMASARRNQVELHLQGCDLCAQFGGVFKTAIQSVKLIGLDHSQKDFPTFERLKMRLDQVTRPKQP